MADPGINEMRSLLLLRATAIKQLAIYEQAIADAVLKSTDSALREALDEVWSVLTAEQVDTLTPETREACKLNHQEVWHGRDQ